MLRPSTKPKNIKCSHQCLVIGFVLFASFFVFCNIRIASQHAAQIGAPQVSANDALYLAPFKQQQPANKLPIFDTPATNDNNNNNSIHIVFSTSCSLKNGWKAYLFFHHAMIHNQTGDVTRIVSGCEPTQKEELTRLHQEQIAIMNPNFHIYFTGKVPGVSHKTTKHWNKPFGVKNWLETRFGYQYKGKITTPFDDHIVVLVDPDMLLQRPFVNDFSEYPTNMWTQHFQNHEDLIYHKVTHGHPMAQDHSFGERWLETTNVLGKSSPVHDVTMQQARTLYSAGPPFVLTARDMYRVAYHWSAFLPRLLDRYPNSVAEMYGYCMAAAHIKLEHQIARGFMVSNVTTTVGEGWSFLDDVTDDACRVDTLSKAVPLVIHFSQRYSIGKFFLRKYTIPTDILSCDVPLLELPPLDIAATTNYSQYGDGSIDVWEGNTAVHRYRNAFMVCSLMPAINKAATFYKDHHCPNGANYNQTWNHFRQR
jgi:hypothetical protein